MQFYSKWVNHKHLSAKTWIRPNVGAFLFYTLQKKKKNKYTKGQNIKHLCLTVNISEKNNSNSRARIYISNGAITLSYTFKSVKKKERTAQGERLDHWWKQVILHQKWENRIECAVYCAGVCSLVATLVDYLWANDSTSTKSSDNGGVE